MGKKDKMTIRGYLRYIIAIITLWVFAPTGAFYVLGGELGAMLGFIFAFIVSLEIKIWLILVP